MLIMVTCIADNESSALLLHHSSCTTNTPNAASLLRTAATTTNGRGLLCRHGCMPSTAPNPGLNPLCLKRCGGFIHKQSKRTSLRATGHKRPPNGHSARAAAAAVGGPRKVVHAPKHTSALHRVTMSHHMRMRGLRALLLPLCPATLQARLRAPPAHAPPAHALCTRAQAASDHWLRSL
jgi:hypothetical protein